MNGRGGSEEMALKREAPALRVAGGGRISGPSRKREVAGAVVGPGDPRVEGREGRSSLGSEMIIDISEMKDNELLSRWLVLVRVE